MNQVLISSDALSMLLAGAGAFFSMAHRSYQNGVPEAPSKEELQGMQIAIKEAVAALGQEASPTLQGIVNLPPII